MRVIFLDSVHPVLNERLSANGFDCVDATQLDRESCEHAIKTAVGIVVRSRFRMDSTFLDHAKQLEFIARSGAGMENIDKEYAQQRGIELFNAPEGNRNAVGEHALGMLLALFNKLHTGDREVRNGKWDREGNRGVELDGKTVGLIGYGNNGTAFAKKLQGFDVKVLAYDKYISGYQTEFVEEVTMQRLFNEADVVSFHIPQTDETLFLADSNFLTSFEKEIYLVNLSRGKIVETKALVTGLKDKSILGACLDVLEYEKSSFETFFTKKLPVEFSYLLNSEKVIFSPHVGGWTHESYFKLSNVLAEKILRRRK